MESPPTSRVSFRDDKATLIAISALACILQDVLHEGLGHGVTAWLSGAHSITLSTVALQSDIDTRWISANGTLVNLLFGIIFWLSWKGRYRPTARYFLILAMAGNVHRNGLFPLLGCAQLRRLGGSHHGPPSALVMASHFDPRWRYFVLRGHVDCALPAEPISGKRT